MSRRASAAVKADQSLQRVENLLEQALNDLTGNQAVAPCSQAAYILAEAGAHLQAFKHCLADTQQDLVCFGSRLRAILPRLKRAEILLAASAEFYRGWCATGVPPAIPTSGYQTDYLAHGPNLLALEG